MLEASNHLSWIPELKHLRPQLLQNCLACFGHREHHHCLPHTKLGGHALETVRICQLPDYHCNPSVHGPGAPKPGARAGVELRAKVHERAMGHSEILSPLLVIPGPKHELLPPVQEPSVSVGSKIGHADLWLQCSYLVLHAAWPAGCLQQHHCPRCNELLKPAADDSGASSV